MYLDDLLNKAHTKHVQGKYEAAVKLYREILKVNPNHLDANYLLGTLYAESGQFPLAEQYLKKADSINSESPYVKINLGNVTLSQGDYQAAQDYYQQALAIRQDIPQVYWGLGNILDTVNNDMEGALPYYQKALELNPDDPFLLHAAGRVMTRLGNNQALEYFHKAYLSNSCLSGLAKDYGIACVKFGKNADAGRYLRQAITLDQQDAESRYYLHIAEGTIPDEALRLEYARSEFDRFAKSFDDVLTERLEYTMPDQLLDFMTEILPPGFHFDSAVDLGCGTGLFGRTVRPHVDRLAGIDISGRMIELAAKRDCYDELYEGDIVATLQGSDLACDLFAATDVLIYIGELEKLFPALRAHAKPGGLFAFSTEHAEGDGFVLQSTGRFAHGCDYIRRIAAENDSVIIAMKQVPLRKEHGEWIMGGMYIVRLRDSLS